VEIDVFLLHKVMSSSTTASFFMHLMFIFILFHVKQFLYILRIFGTPRNQPRSATAWHLFVKIK